MDVLVIIIKTIAALVAFGVAFMAIGSVIIGV
jgi:hypothetical protein